jgi:Ca2+-binding EF-hand superfamily protein
MSLSKPMVAFIAWHCTSHAFWPSRRGATDSLQAKTEQLSQLLQTLEQELGGLLTEEEIQEFVALMDENSDGVIGVGLFDEMTKFGTAALVQHSMIGCASSDQRAAAIGPLLGAYTIDNCRL